MVCHCLLKSFLLQIKNILKGYMLLVKSPLDSLERFLKGLDDWQVVQTDQTVPLGAV